MSLDAVVRRVRYPFIYIALPCLLYFANVFFFSEMRKRCQQFSIKYLGYSIKPLEIIDLM